jgi:hypothetical protein
LLTDYASLVVILGIVDFTDQANEAFERSAAGMWLVKSTDAPKMWPSFLP